MSLVGSTEQCIYIAEKEISSKDKAEIKHLQPNPDLSSTSLAGEALALASVLVTRSEHARFTKEGRVGCSGDRA